MKAQDLRIGNYVQLYGKQVKVLEIWDTALKTTDIRTNCAYFIEQYSPIPLTEETLLKCGFELKGVIFRINNGALHQFDINYSPSRDMFYYDSSKYGVYTEVEIKYLHQLQNLYYILIGKELNYETN